MMNKDLKVNKAYFLFITLLSFLFIFTACIQGKENKLVANKQKESTERAKDEKHTSDSQGKQEKEDKKDNSSKDNKVEDKKEDKKVELVPYTGKVEHIFVHTLIAYPELAFDGEGTANDFDDWFVTVGEFKKIIDSLYKKNFILVDINSLYEEVTVNNEKRMQRKPIMVPKDKKPIILSVDDINYNRYMLHNGPNHKLVLDKDGNVAAYSINPKGEEVIVRDNEVIPIIDKFIEEHPDFSLNGAKGVLALTGYEGILGYRTDRNSKSKESEKKEALKIVARLKETGWTFASHSYGHPNMRERTYAKAVDDTDKWQKEVETLIGPTQVYIYPFGAGLKETDGKFKYLQSKGFKIFCHVGASSYERISTSTNAVITDRRHVDGISLRKSRESFLDLYDAHEILDLKVRPKR